MLRLAHRPGHRGVGVSPELFHGLCPPGAAAGGVSGPGLGGEDGGGPLALYPKGFLVSNQLIGDLLDRQEQAQLSDVLVRAREHYAARGPEEG